MNIVGPESRLQLLWFMLTLRFFFKFVSLANCSNSYPPTTLESRINEQVVYWKMKKKSHHYPFIIFSKKSHLYIYSHLYFYYFCTFVQLYHLFKIHCGPFWPQMTSEATLRPQLGEIILQLINFWSEFQANSPIPLLNATKKPHLYLYSDLYIY